MIKIKNISFSYPNTIKQNVFFISGLNLQINSGDFISIMGPNGSGKSTLLRLISRLLIPQNGNIYFDDKNINLIPGNEFARNFAFVPQNTNILFPYSVYETVMMGRSPYLNFFGLESEKDHEKVTEILKLLEIYDIKDKGMNEISGGESQRTLIARALAQEPKVILLDEPNAHLDVKHQVRIFNLLKKFNAEKNITTIIISHDLNLTNYFCDRAILMKEGSIVFDSTPREVLTEENIKNVFGVNTKIINSQFNKQQFISIDPANY